MLKEKKPTKSDKIRRLLAKGVDRQTIAKKLNVSDQLIYAVAVRGGYVKKKAKKTKKPSKIIKAVEQMDLELKNLLIVKGIDKGIDKVNHPPHYRTGGIETIDFIEAKDLNYRLGNVIKYVSRAGRKLDSDPVEDLEKAAWYLNRELEARRNA